MTTTRRDALKLGAIAAAPLAALVPTAAAAVDSDTAARLARLEDERALEGQVRRFIREFNTGSDRKLTSAEWGAAPFFDDVTHVREERDHEPSVTFGHQSTDVRSARWIGHVETTHEVTFDGDTTAEKMARFQGHGSASTRERRKIDVLFSHGPGGDWYVTHVALRDINWRP